MDADVFRMLLASGIGLLSLGCVMLCVYVLFLREEVSDEMNLGPHLMLATAAIPGIQEGLRFHEKCGCCGDQLRVVTDKLVPALQTPDAQKMEPVLREIHSSAIRGRGRMPLISRIFTEGSCSKTKRNDMAVDPIYAMISVPIKTEGSDEPFGFITPFGMPTEAKKFSSDLALRRVMSEITPHLEKDHRFVLPEALFYYPYTKGEDVPGVLDFPSGKYYLVSGVSSELPEQKMVATNWFYRRGPAKWRIASLEASQGPMVRESGTLDVAVVVAAIYCSQKYLGRHDSLASVA